MSDAKTDAAKWLWNKVKSISREHTKRANVGGQDMLSVNSIAMVELLTSAIGPIGDKWFYSIKEERYDNTRPLMIGGAPVIVDGATLWEQTHTVRLEFYIDHGPGFHSFEQYGHTPYRYATSSGKIMVDQEAPKKSVTDALKKCMSLLGVAADVYSGALDNPDYAAQVDDEMKIKQADSDAQKTDEMLAEMKAALDSTLRFIAECDYEIAARTANKNITYFNHRLVSITPRIKHAAASALTQIKAALEAKKQEQSK